MSDSLAAASEMKICVQAIQEGKLPKENSQGVGETAQRGEEAKAKTHCSLILGAAPEPTA